LIILYMVISLIVAICTLVLTILKIVGVIAWAWGWVLAPIWSMWFLMALAFVATLYYPTYQKRQKEKARLSGQSVTN
jgi:hypothetical protein